MFIFDAKGAFFDADNIAIACVNSYCHNGGQCDYNTGKCICPLRWAGNKDCTACGCQDQDVCTEDLCFGDPCVTADHNDPCNTEQTWSCQNPPIQGCVPTTGIPTTGVVTTGVVTTGTTMDTQTGGTGSQTSSQTSSQSGSNPTTTATGSTETGTNSNTNSNTPSNSETGSETISSNSMSDDDEEEQQESAASQEFIVTSVGMIFAAILSLRY